VPGELGGAVAVEGLRELRRDLKRMDPELLKGVRTALREAAQIVADEAKRRAPRSGRSGTHMADTIRPRLRGDSAEVRVGARRKSQRYPSGYRYPSRIEFEGGLGRDPGPHAFLRPALLAKSDEVQHRMEQLLDDIANVWED
jgi:hypothetical protein